MKKTTKKKPVTKKAATKKPVKRSGGKAKAASKAFPIKFIIGGVAAAALVAAAVLVARGMAGGASSGGKSGYLTFSDGIPTDFTYYVSVVPNNTATTLSALADAASARNAIARGVPMQPEYSADSFFLYAPGNNDTVWTGAGTYMVVTMAGTSSNFRWIKNVSFKDGSATIKASDLKAPTQ